MNGRILVTGASGFIGRRLVPALVEGGHAAVAALRRPGEQVAVPTEVVVQPDLSQPIDWRPLLEGVDTVIHLAGLAHAGASASDQRLWQINVDATRTLAQSAAAAGVRHLVFMSSIRAQTGPSHSGILTETDAPVPADAYGRSKLAAEQAIQDAGVDFTILRPVVVYGPSVGGNLAALIRLAKLPCPLPFASVAGSRSLLGIDNLVSAVQHCMRPDLPRRETYIVADPTPLRISEMIATIRAGLGRNASLFPVPEPLLRGAFALAGQADAWRRLGGSLVASPQKLLQTGWTCPTSTREGLMAMARASAS